ncbi:tRNA-dihydrouridine(47) synthase [NAD(P)(+)]-like [Ricinus communis]|uniref:tRNA-dihydrouridine(47) synthase [NAD(P)(+)] n=1 Tax=Ricinus communis TaxID=3988 RepID=B9RG59_RICCO|nr:tRNA-dihydrouridine(47) synthase [NAD(P)(+)]-like [Ricinus communis]EEF49514.1 tRNA-dihydrouridine synthase, putative [Ricinus communis]|eukprot:XP_002513011.1 tRNA-dihydrouridine(47) synthase [NAD(P)(+)]-like [Ricinus communis]
MADSATELAEQPPLCKTNGTNNPTPEQLVAKAIAPVKAEFLRPPPPSRTNQNDTVIPNSDAKAASQSIVSKEKKSKRQLKRERREEKKSALNLCPELAKTEDVNSCRYGDKCRFSHDLEAFKAQKPDDIEGKCPFINGEGKACPYGLACRFYSTHENGVKGDASNTRKQSSEVNGLNKDVQKLLWKNRFKFPKADAILKSLGLMGPSNSRVKRQNDDEVDNASVNDSHAASENGCGKLATDAADKLECPSEVLTEDNADAVTDEIRPLKKAKSDVDEKCCSGEEANGASVPEKDSEDSFKETESDAVNNGALTEPDGSLKTHPREKKLIDFKGKLYLAPLTTVGNLPFRRLCKLLGADITCGEMAMCTNLLQGQASEWALLRRHSSEDLFGVQICGAYSDTVARTVELIDQECTVDFIDINMGCPIDIVVSKGAGSCLLTKPMRMKSIIHAASSTVDTPITVKVRTGYFEGKNRIDSLIADISNWGTNAVTIHGRSRQQRYSKLADWEYIYHCAKKAPESFQVLGNGDIFSYTDWNKHKSDCPELSSCMIARGALIKPWLFTEIKEQRHWDIRSGERLDILKDYVHFGLEHWGSDTKGIETTRHFLLEWLSYTCRYIPVGLLDVIPQRINWRPPSYYGRDDLETLMASDSAADWIRISEMLLGKVPEGFTFAPKHKSNAYDRAENG